MRLQVLGPEVELLTAPEQEPCVMRGTIPPGVAVGIHAHAEPETFIGVSGEVEGLLGDRWTPLGPGDVVHVPGHVPHAWRNRSGEPAVTVVVTGAAIWRFFTEVAGPPSPEALERFATVAARYGHWLAPPEENAAAGI
jgi:quercetin dioxygenase-like cupin family protein